jgi:hypothetical protein
MNMSVLHALGELVPLSQTALDEPESVNRAVMALEGDLLPMAAEETSVPPDIDPETVAALNALYERYEVNLEKRYASLVIRRLTTVHNYPLYGRFERLIAKEVETAELKAKDRILFIGSGPFPISPILLHEKTGGAVIDCYDSSAEACRTSRELLGKLGMSNVVRVHELAGQDAELPTVDSPGELGVYDAIVVALLAQPKRALLHRIWLSNPGAKVILRTSDGNRRLLYAGMDVSTLDRAHFTQTGEYHAGSFDTISGVVLSPGPQMPRIFSI